MGNGISFKIRKLFNCCGGDIKIKIRCFKCFECEVDKKEGETEEKDIELDVDCGCFKFRRNQISPSCHINHTDIDISNNHKKNV